MTTDHDNGPACVRSDPVHGDTFEHPAYGAITCNHVAGQTDLFMVDYPQGHFVRITVHTAQYTRNLANDWVHPHDDIVSFYMSEVQWARFVASIGQGSGVPCTLSRYRNPNTGKVTCAEMHKEGQTRSDLFMSEVQERANDATTELDKALALVKAMADGGNVRKRDLQEAVRALDHAKMQMTNSIPWVVQQAGEAIETAVESGKAELDTYQQFATQRLGLQALAEQANPTQARLPLRKSGKRET